MSFLRVSKSTWEPGSPPANQLASSDRAREMNGVWRSAVPLAMLLGIALRYLYFLEASCPIECVTEWMRNI